MKKIYFFYAVASLSLAIGCSGNGAFSDQEKKAQDSIDKVNQDEGFNDLEKQGGDTSMRKRVENPEGPDPNATKAGGNPNDPVIPAGGNQPYVAPEKDKAGTINATGELPSPPIQERK